MAKLTLLLTLLISFQVSAGPIGSGGTDAPEFMRCRGTSTDGRDVVLAMAARPTPVVGMYATVKSGSELLFDGRITDTDDQSPIGIIYSNSSLRVIVPNIQGPNHQPGTFSASLQIVGDQSISANLSCGKN